MSYVYQVITKKEQAQKASADLQIEETGIWGEEKFSNLGTQRIGRSKYISITKGKKRK